VTPWVQRLLFANIAMFFIQMTMPAVDSALAFVPSLVLIRPWTIVTYMFLHGGIMHIAFNMLGLFFFGSQVEDRLGSRQFVTLYFVSGIAGALLSLMLAPNSSIVGASAGVFGVMLAFAYFWPKTEIYIWGVLPVQARWLVIITTLLALYSGMSGSRGGVADFAHLGGYVGAYLYLRWVGRSSVAGGRSKPAKTRATTAQDKVLVGKWKAIDTKSIHEINREEVNRILDKISASGVGTLTESERIFLSNFVPPDDRVPPVS
jgi:membrane associated rhomboid family serine protease